MAVRDTKRVMGGTSMQSSRSRQAIAILDRYVEEPKSFGVLSLGFPKVREDAMTFSYKSSQDDEVRCFCLCKY